jgi:hypothetical protein
MCKNVKTLLAVSAVYLSLSTSGAFATVREPAVAGMFYPADSAELAQMVQRHLDNVTDLPAIDGQIIALVVPHAGLIYSGQIAAYCYKYLEGATVDKVILCGPSHRFGFQGLSVYGPGIEWRTPLGKVACDDRLCTRLLEFDKRIGAIEQAHASEHSLEVQLPYLQTVLKNFKLVPIVMGYQDSATISLLSDALKSLETNERTILIAATDWQHYRPASVGWKMDSLGIECLKALDPKRLEKYLQSGRVEACGGGPAVAVLKAAIAKGADKVKILKYGDSGDITGDKSSVVSYIAAVVYKSTPKKETSTSTETKPKPRKENLPSTFSLSDAEKKLLLTIARQSIRQYLTDGSLPEFEVTDNLKKPGAAFVTLKKNGLLRGCIGHIIAREPLYKTVSMCAVQAAVADRRFLPVQPDELPKLDIEISVLTPLQEVKSLDDIEVGRDGLVISLGNNRGLLLPQVATEYGWDRTQFLEQTCRKAGLPPDAYKSPSAHIQKFQAVVFGE